MLKWKWSNKLWLDLIITVVLFILFVNITTAILWYTLNYQTGIVDWSWRSFQYVLLGAYAIWFVWRAFVVGPDDL